ncbi:MAG: TIGR03643 family protein [Flavobacteriaceae bacterium]
MIEKKEFSVDQIDRIIEMAWEDRTPFDAIALQFDISEKEVIKLMRREMKPSSFKMWRARVQGRKTKHLKKVATAVDRFKCSRQRGISNNKISKRK